MLIGYYAMLIYVRIFVEMVTLEIQAGRGLDNTALDLLRQLYTAVASSAGVERVLPHLGLYTQILGVH